MATYRKPTEKESEMLEEARRRMRKGIEGEKDILSKLMPTMAKSARDEIRKAKEMRESVPEAAREYEAYQDSGHAKGGRISASRRAKKYALGGEVDAPQQPTYPFSMNQAAGGGDSGAGGVNQTFNIQPQAMNEPPGSGGTIFKKGGKVSASRRADGIAVRGKTRGKMV